MLSHHNWFKVMEIHEEPIFHLKHRNRFFEELFEEMVL